MPDKIEWSSATKLSELLTVYPWLKEELTSISDKFRMLHSPLGKVMANKATLSEMSRRSGIDEPILIEKLQTLVALHAQ